MDQTDRSQRGVLCGKLEEMAKEHICICAYPMGTDNNVVKARGWGLSGEEERRNREHCNSVNNNNNHKKT